MYTKNRITDFCHEDRKKHFYCDNIVLNSTPFTIRLYKMLCGQDLIMTSSVFV